MSSRKAPAQQEIDEEYLRSLMAAPEPAASSSDTEVSEQAETPASEPRVRRSDAEDYASRFLKNTPSEARQCVYIDRRLPRKITTLVGVAGNRRFTVGNFIDNVLDSTSSGTGRKYGRSAPKDSIKFYKDDTRYENHGSPRRAVPRAVLLPVSG